MGQLCFNCTFKHLACAWVAWCEVHNGYHEPQHIMKVVGHMANAEEHLIDEYPTLAARVRDERTCFWDAIQINTMYRPDFEALVIEVWELLLTDQYGEADGQKEEKEDE